MIHTIDQTQPNAGAKWAFDEAVTAVFPNMLARSIPAHDEMRKLVYAISSRFIQDGDDIVDLGCSRGAALRPIVDWHGPYVRCVGLDESQPMLDACVQEFEVETAIGFKIDIRHHDLRNGLPDDVRPSLTMAILTLQFVPIEYRQRIVADVYAKTKPGGAFIVVEKILGSDAAADRLLVETYYAGKKANGYTAEQVEAKRKSLEGVLVPLTASGNVALLEAEGFNVTQFWQHLNFAGWLAVKPKAGV